MNPYSVLNVPWDADDETIRKAYLTAIQQASPERDPKRFAALSDSYQRIRTADDRANYELEGGAPPASSPGEAAVRWARTRPEFPPLPINRIRKLFESCRHS